MSRKASSQGGQQAKGLPPSHPAEYYPEHRAFLVRSLDRCDTELAALVQLNRSLHKTKAAIIETCGEGTLLDLGEGLLKLNHNDQLEGRDLPQEQQDLCVDFLLRMKLRRKLLNRLARRLNRLSHAMDGQEVQPPPPPRYGDSRLDISSSILKKYRERWTRQEAARRRVEWHRQTKSQIIKQSWTETEEEEHLKKYMSDDDDEKVKNATEENEDVSTKKDEADKQEEKGDEVKTAADTATKKDEAKEDDAKMQVEGDGDKMTKDTAQDVEAMETDDRPEGDKSSYDEEKEKEVKKDSDEAMEIDGKPEEAKPSPVEEKEKEVKMGSEDKLEGVASGERDAEEAKETEGKLEAATSLPGEDKTEAPTNEPSAADETKSSEGVTSTAKDDKRDEDMSFKTEAPTNEPSVDETKSSEGVTSTADNDDEDKSSKTEAPPNEPSADETKSGENVTSTADKDHKTFSPEAPADKPSADEAKSGEDVTSTASKEDNTSSPEAPAKEPSADEAKSGGGVPEPTAEDFEALRDFDDGYEKEVMLSTGAVKYPILEEQGLFDHNSTNYGSGVGASHRSMSSREKEIEYKRWQNSILERIPQQPTFDELGLANRVFNLEARRKRLEEEDLTSPSKKRKKSDEDMSKKRKKSDDDDDMDIDEKSEDDDEEEDESEKDDDEEFNPDGEKESEDEDEQKDKEAEAEEDEKAEVVLSAPVRPISLAPIPSFQEQDNRRIRTIHADLMATSIHEHARKRIADVTLEYNQAFRRSTELYSRRSQLQADLQKLQFDHRMKVEKLKHDYNVEISIARSRWHERKQAYDVQRAARSMPSTYGRPATGTPTTSAAAAGPDRIHAEVAPVLANMVDGVVMRAEPGWKDIEPFEEFNPPPPPDMTGIVVDQKTGETLGQRQEAVQTSIQKDIERLSSALRKSEEERNSAWRKMLKTKADFDMPHQQMTSGGGGRRGRTSVNPSHFHLLPLPPLRASSTASIPPTSSYTIPTPSYPIPMRMAPPPPPPPSSTSAQAQKTDYSKYAAAKVKERIAPDGTVAPVTEPKRNKDGLYQRPAGRQRKGMDWDAFRGIWVPSESGDDS